MKIAYLTSMYPDVSHTFILREVRALRAREVDVITFSVRRPERRNILGSEAHMEAARTRWLVPPRAGQLAAAMAWAATTRPLVALRTLTQAGLNRATPATQRIKWACYFVEAVLLAWWLKREAVSHLHCHFGNSGASTGMLAARLAGIPFSMTCHGSELREMERHRLAEKVSRAAFVACVSHYGRAQLMLACPPEHWDRLHVVRCGVPRVDGSAMAPDAAVRRILCVGRLSPEKGHLTLLDALARLRDGGTTFVCTFVGDGPMRGAVEARIEELRLGSCMTLTGSLDSDRLPKFYRTADVVVLASLSEGVPVVLMEAMAHGRPVVATRVGGVAELVEHGQSGLLVAPGDAAALADALRKVLDDPALARTLGANGARRVSEEFNIDASADRLRELFDEVDRRRAEAHTGYRGDKTPCRTRLATQDS